MLIDLLAVLPAEPVAEIESILYQLAGDSAPKTPAGTEPGDKKKCRDAWAAWWKINAARVDLGRLKERPWYGYTLICDTARNRVYEIDRNGKERWAINNVVQPFDAVVLPGNRVLIAEFNSNRVTERDFKGKILWTKQVNGNPSNVQRLANGNTLVAMNGGAIVEVDRDGKEVYTITNVPGNVLAAKRSRQGTIFCMTFNGQCLVLDTTGKQLKSFATHHDANSMGGIDLMPNGHILITRQAQGKVAEYDRDGKLVLELDAPGADGDWIAERPHSRGRAGHATSLRTGPHRQNRLGTQGPASPSECGGDEPLAAVGGGNPAPTAASGVSSFVGRTPV